jgi:hypothetical protein
MSASKIAGQIPEKEAPTVAAAPIISGATTFYCSVGVLVIALKGNANTVYLGNSSVTTANGYPLGAGDAVFLPILDPSSIYIIASIANQKVRAIGV